MAEKKFKNRNLFDYLKNILKDKSLEMYNQHISDEGFDTDFKKFMEVRYLSMCNNPSVRNIILENQFLLEQMEPKTLYRFLINIVPKQYNHFINYIK